MEKLKILTQNQYLSRSSDERSDWTPSILYRIRSDPRYFTPETRSNKEKEIVKKSRYLGDPGSGSTKPGYIISCLGDPEPAAGVWAHQSCARAPRRADAGQALGLQ